MLAGPEVLKRHIAFVHDKVKKFKCDLCDRKFSIKGQIRTHNRMFHIKGNYECDICERQFSVPEYLKKHIKGVHYKKWDHSFLCSM